ncbi:MAG: TetR family transcriptional regulator [Proteobacteria bacterium]|nr:MAG: TetR family transcriptional regulator [Pseudomonadota bacterium]
MTCAASDPSSRRSQADTRERILRAAEASFVERGFAATSLRMITARAKVNLAAVNYHFGSKESLVREVFQRHLAPLNQARIAYLDRLEAGAAGAPLSPEKIIEAMLAPVLQVSADPLRGGAVFLRLLGRAFTEPADSVRELLQAQYRDVIVRFKEALRCALPMLPEQDLVWRMHFMFGAMSYTLAGNDALRLIADCRLVGADDAPTVIQRLVPFLTAGLQAPPAALTAASDPSEGVSESARVSRKAA